MYNIGEFLNLKKYDKSILAWADKTHLFGTRLLSANEHSRTKAKQPKEELSKKIWASVRTFT